MKWTALPEWSEASIKATGGRMPPSLMRVIDEGLDKTEPYFAALLFNYWDRIRFRFDDKLGWLSRRAAGPTPVWVWKNEIRIAPGEWMKKGGLLDLSGPFGMSILVHEVVHCIQYLHRGTLATALELWLPWTLGKQHADIQWEEEASSVEASFRRWAVS